MPAGPSQPLVRSEGASVGVLLGQADSALEVARARVSLGMGTACRQGKRGGEGEGQSERVTG